MSHYTVMVHLTQPRLTRHSGSVEAALAEMLAPYDENADAPTAAKWDWYAIGGRWLGFFAVKPGTTLRLGSPGTFNNQPTPGQADIVYRRDLDTDKPVRTTFAVLNDDGWHEPGSMGWFGMSSTTPESGADFKEKFEERFINKCAPDDTLVVVDCHI